METTRSDQRHGKESGDWGRKISIGVDKRINYGLYDQDYICNWKECCKDAKFKKTKVTLSSRIQRGLCAFSYLF